MMRTYFMACFVMIAACGGDDELTLREAQPDRSDQYAARRRLLNIRVIDGNNALSSFPKS